MFDYSLLHWTTFFVAAAALHLAPGPDMAFILGHSVRGGRRAGFAAMGGVWVGALAHAMLAAAGLSAILASSALAFAIVKWVGAAYLIWLGVAALRSRGAGALGSPGAVGSLGALGRPARAASWRIARQGVMVSLLNPKVAMFFLAFLPQFVEPGAGPAWAQLLLHGVLIIFVAALIEPPLVMIAGGLSEALRRRPSIGLWLDRTLGALLIGLGARLALQER
ncbi:MAG: LysE family translocator [Pseudomonadota bacterium]